MILNNTCLPSQYTTSKPLKQCFQYRALFSKGPDPKPLYVREFSCYVEKNEAMKPGQLLKVDRRLRGDVTAVIKYIKGWRKKEGSNLFSTSRVDSIKNNRLKSQQETLTFHKKKKLVSSKALDYATRGSSSLSSHLQNSYPDNPQEQLRHWALETPSQPLFWQFFHAHFSKAQKLAAGWDTTNPRMVTST